MFDQPIAEQDVGCVRLVPLAPRRILLFDPEGVVSRVGVDVDHFTFVVVAGDLCRVHGFIVPEVLTHLVLRHGDLRWLDVAEHRDR